jgi:peptidyl-prolyl cis-trans isomerase-like 4
MRLIGTQARFFEDEIKPGLRHKKAGRLSMANLNRPHTNSSQFLVTTRDDCGGLDDHNTLFGEVVEGMDTLKLINDAYCDEG